MGQGLDRVGVRVWHGRASQAKEIIEPKESNELCALLLKPKDQICPKAR